MVDDLITSSEYLIAISAHSDIYCVFHEYKEIVNIITVVLQILYFCLTIL